MEPIEIEVNGRLLIAMPQPDGSFAILDGDNMLGTITPVLRDVEDIEWVPMDLLAADYAQSIGEAIERLEK